MKTDPYILTTLASVPPLYAQAGTKFNALSFCFFTNMKENNIFYVIEFDHSDGERLFTFHVHKRCEFEYVCLSSLLVFKRYGLIKMRPKTIAEIMRNLKMKKHPAITEYEYRWGVTI